MNRGLILCLSLTALSLSACGSFGRSDDATAARHKMVGMTKEQVLVCMGVPSKKANTGSTEVWSYTSTDGGGSSPSFSQKLSSGLTFRDTEKQKLSCIVNVVMTNDVVNVVHYNGPRGGLFNPDEQCGYAVEHCVE